MCTNKCNCNDSGWGSSSSGDSDEPDYRRRCSREHIRIELLEQPVKASDFEGLKFVKEHVMVPVVADESASTPQDVFKIIQMRAADMINIKLMKTGGIYNALALCAMAKRAHIGFMIGCMMESKVSVTAAAHLAAARNIKICDLDPPIFSPDCFAGGAVYDKSLITLPDEPGLGFKNISSFHFGADK